MLSGISRLRRAIFERVPPGLGGRAHVVLGEFLRARVNPSINVGSPVIPGTPDLENSDFAAETDIAPRGVRDAEFVGYGFGLDEASHAPSSFHERMVTQTTRVG
jgi:hypothetical protein